MEEINRQSALYLRLQRQNLIVRDHTPYDALFRAMSPVPTQFWVEPGAPPTIEKRFSKDDRDLNDSRRLDRTIIKGRFRGGNVGYIFREELPLHRAAYKKDLSSLNETDELVMDTIRQEGAMSLALIKEITGLLSKQISASAQKLQKAFILYEDQVDKERDRAFYILEDEFYDLDFAMAPLEAVCELIKRFSFLNVFFNETMVKSLTRLPTKIIREASHELLNEDVLVPVLSGGDSFYALKNDLDQIKEAPGELPQDILVLDLNDYYVKCQEITLKEAYGQKEYKTLNYILKGGAFIGAVLGFFRYGPNDLEDVVLSLSQEDQAKYGEAIIDAVYSVYDRELHQLKRYCGKLI